MQIELLVKWFDVEWLGQIVLLLLFSNEGKSLSKSERNTNTQNHQATEWSQRLGVWRWYFQTKEAAGQSARAGRVDKRLCSNFSKANNHSGRDEEYYIRVPNQYHITLSLGVYTRLIKLIIFDATLAVSFSRALDNYYCSITGLCVNREKKNKDKWIFIWLK